MTTHVSFLGQCDFFFILLEDKERVKRGKLRVRQDPNQGPGADAREAGFQSGAYRL